MKIKEVNIKAFRSIKNVSFRLDDISAIVGENNAGKTSILRALNAFFNYKSEHQYFISRSHQYTPHANTYITITFTDIPQKDMYNNKLNNGMLTIRFSYDYSKSRKSFYNLKGREKIALEDTFIESISNDIQYVYIPAGRSDKDVYWTADSIFKQLIERFTQQNIIRDHYSKSIRAAGTTLHKNVLQKLEKEINNLYLQGRNVDFQLNFPSDPDYKLLLDKIELSLNTGVANYPMQDWGSGTKSLAIIAMYRALAQLNNTSIVLGIEEPETNLHPQAQKRFIISLREQLHDHESQTIFTTHSTVLVDELNHEDILLARQVKSDMRDEGFYTDVKQVPIDFWAIHNLNEEKPYQFFNYRNSDFFFAKYVVIGESKNDCQVFRSLLNKKVGSRIADVSFLNAEGVDNLIYPYYLLKELNIPFTIIVDKDFFFPYSENNELEKSRSPKTGLPTYEYKLKTNDIIMDMFPDENKRKHLESIANGYRKYFIELEKHNILSMSHCLEMDLTCTEKARQQFYSILNMTPNEQTQYTLLTKKYKTIKRTDKIIRVLNAIPESSYPESYLKIRNSVAEKIKLYVPE